MEKVAKSPKINDFQKSRDRASSISRTTRYQALISARQELAMGCPKTIRCPQTHAVVRLWRYLQKTKKVANFCCHSPALGHPHPSIAPGILKVVVRHSIRVTRIPELKGITQRSISRPYSDRNDPQGVSKSSCPCMRLCRPLFSNRSMPRSPVAYNPRVHR